MSNYQYDMQVNDIIFASLRMLNAYAEGETPSPEKVENARIALNNILDALENEGARYWKRVWRQKVFEEASIVVGTDGLYYRCYNPHASINASAWATGAVYDLNSYVYPTTYNGYYYELTSITDAGGMTDVASAISGSTEPTFPTEQDKTVNETGADYTLTWTCKPDNKPVTGKNYAAYWYQDANHNSGSTWAINTSYYAAGCFNLQNDELTIERAFIRQTNEGEYPVSIVRSSDWADIHSKWLESIPDTLYIDWQSRYSAICRLYPLPSVIGATGYIFHYQAAVKNQNYNETGDLDLPDNIYRYLQFQLASDLSYGYHNVDNDFRLLLEKKASALKKQAIIKQTTPESGRIIKSCY